MALSTSVLTAAKSKGLKSNPACRSGTTPVRVQCVKSKETKHRGARPRHGRNTNKPSIDTTVSTRAKHRMLGYDASFFLHSAMRESFFVRTYQHIRAFFHCRRCSRILRRKDTKLYCSTECGAGSAHVGVVLSAPPGIARNWRAFWITQAEKPDARRAFVRDRSWHPRNVENMLYETLVKTFPATVPSATDEMFDVTAATTEPEKICMRLERLAHGHTSTVKP